MCINCFYFVNINQYIYTMSNEELIQIIEEKIQYILTELEKYDTKESIDANQERIHHLEGGLFAFEFLMAKLTVERT
jgi:hypothetical protein